MSIAEWRKTKGPLAGRQRRMLVAVAVWVFAHVGTAAAAPCFGPEHLPYNALDSGSPDLGTVPEFADIDGDGDLDVFMAMASGVTFFENIGTAGEPSFGPPVLSPFGLATSPNGVVRLADIDDDGDLDAFHASLPAGDVDFFENIGTTGPEFAAPQTNPFGLPASTFLIGSFDLADLDGDGDLDAVGGLPVVLVENVGSEGSPDFGAGVSDPLGLAMVDTLLLGLVDIDGDGDLDAFGSLLGAGIVQYAENTGGAFGPAQPNPFGLSGFGPHGFADLDDDGDLDALFGASTLLGTSIAFFENVGSATVPDFVHIVATAAYAGTSCSDGDVCNGDEVCDGAGTCLAAPPAPNGTSCPSDGDVCNGFEVCDGAGSCTSPTPAPSGTACPSDGDVCNGVEVCDGAGACVAPTPAPSGTSCPSDGDVCNGVEVCDGAGSCVAPAPAPAGVSCGTSDACGADVCDGTGGCVLAPDPAGTACDDGILCTEADACDGAGACSGVPVPDCRLCFLPAQPVPGDQPWDIFSTWAGSGVPVLELADFDGDGDLDALSMDNDQVVVRENLGSEAAPHFGPATQLFGTWYGDELAVGDLDNDGDMDLIELFTDTDSYYVGIDLHTNDGVSFTRSYIGGIDGFEYVYEFGFDHRVELVDLDDDGDLDVLFLGGVELFWENIGTPDEPDFTWAPELNRFGLYPEPQGFGRGAMGVVDVNHDGTPDLLDAKGAQSTLFENVGSVGDPVFAPGVPFASFDRPVVEFADIDNDDDLDAIGYDQPGRSLVFFENDCLCGNGELDPGEACDDGDNDDGGVCNATCTVLNTCGNGVVDAQYGEACDDGNNDDGDYCSADCRITSVCGDGVVELEEVCDDGNVNDGDCCSATCAAEPAGPAANSCAGTCDGAGHSASCTNDFERAQLVVSETKPGKEKLIAKLQRGPALLAADFGDPTMPGGTAYELNVCDDRGTLVAQLHVDRAAALCGAKDCWKPLGPLGYAYKDGDASADGVSTMRLKGGADGRSQIQVQAKNNAKKGQQSLPTGIASALSNSDGGVTVSLIASNDSCFSTTIPGVLKNDGKTFKAKK